MRILAISGSLRAQSSNTSLLRALMLVAPPELEVVLYKELDQIPPFNPDREEVSEASPVARFRAEVRDSAAVVFSTPEYAHGIPGALKNALDWIVGSGELSGKPVVLLNASSRGKYAQESLREVLKTMDARVLADAEVTLELLGKDLNAEEIAGKEEYATALHSFLTHLA